MDLGFCGLLDIIIVSLGLISLFIGYKKGFIHKFLILFGFLIALALAILFCNAWANQMREWGWFYPGIRDGIQNSMLSYTGSNELTVDNVAAALNTNTFNAWLVLKFSGATTVSGIAEPAAMIAMKGIAFLMIFGGTIVVILVLLIISKALRNVTFVRVVDGILGMLLSLIIYTAVVTLLLFLVSLAYKNFGWTGMNEWLETDMQLLNNNFRLSKWIFQGNLFSFIVNLFS